VLVEDLLSDDNAVLTITGVRRSVAMSSSIFTPCRNGRSEQPFWSQNIGICVAPLT